MVHRRELVVICVLAVFGGVSIHAAETAKKGRPATKSKAVRLVIDYGDGVEKHFTTLAWKSQMTVFGLLQAAGAHPHGISLKYRGKGATLFVEQIDDLKNEGRGRNWIFRVNNRLADRSCDAQTVNPGDTVLWRFGEYR